MANILIIDNNPQFREVMAENVLEPAGHTVYHAGNPVDAREALASNLIHLAIVDVRLTNDDDPNDTSGLWLCEEMDPSVARIIVTAYPDWHLVRAALEPIQGRHRLADGFVTKPEWPKCWPRRFAVFSRKNSK